MGMGVLFLSLSALSLAISINLRVCLKLACSAWETRTLPFSIISSLN